MLCFRSLSPIPAWLEERAIIAAAPWNKDKISFVLRRRNLTFEGCPVSALAMRFYPCALDPALAEYSGLPKSLAGPDIRVHTLPGFWSNFKHGVFERCYFTNPIGLEILVDKAISSFFPMLVRYYCKRKPLVATSGYFAAVESDGITPNHGLLDEVERCPEAWVVKSRRESGQSAGVFRGDLAVRGSYRGSIESWS